MAYARANGNSCRHYAFIQLLQVKSTNSRHISIQLTVALLVASENCGKDYIDDMEIVPKDAVVNLPNISMEMIIPTPSSVYMRRKRKESYHSWTL